MMNFIFFQLSLFNAIRATTDGSFVSSCDTLCGAPSTSFGGKFVSFEDSALRLAEHECGVCKLSTDPCRPPFAQIPLSGPERIDATNTQEEEILCCRRDQADECTQSRSGQVWYYVRQIFVEILGCIHGLLEYIWLCYISIQETFINFYFEVSIAIALLTICIIAAYRPRSMIGHRLSRSDIQRRLEAWPPPYMTHDTIKSEAYWPLILPPGSVKYQDSSTAKASGWRPPTLNRRVASSEQVTSPKNLFNQHIAFGKMVFGVLSTTPPVTPKSPLHEDEEEKTNTTSSTLEEKKKRGSSSSLSSYGSLDHSPPDSQRGRSPSSSSTDSFPFPYEFDSNLDLKTYSPVLFFVNTQSGGQFGWELLKTLRVLIHPAQIVDLNEKSRIKAVNVLNCFVNKFESKLRIVVAGGDGSVGWILEMLDELDDDMKIQLPSYPPIAVIPYGVGNDMARVLGWSHPCFTPASVQNYLVDIMEARVVGLDRWQFKSERLDKGRRGSITTLKKEQVFNNYFGIGTDATVSRGFQILRNMAPSICMSKVINMTHYFWIGAIEAALRTNQRLQKNVQVICDGKEMDLDPDIEGIVIGNIASYAGGLKLWHETDDSAMSLQQDGKLNVCLLRGADHLGMFQIGLARAVNLCQASKIELVFQRTTVMHTDGEPWYQPASRICISPSTRVTKACFLKKIGPSGLGEAQFNTLLQKAVREGIADEAQMAWFQKEMAVRMEHAEEKKRKQQTKGFSFSNYLRFF